MNAIRPAGLLFALAALLLQQAPLFAARQASAHYSDISGIYGFGSAYMISPNFEQNGNVQEVSVSTQVGNAFSQRTGRRFDLAWRIAAAVRWAWRGRIWRS